MVKSRLTTHARITRNTTAEAINIFGKTLVLRAVTRTIDDNGKVSNISTSDTSFVGDLQFGSDLEQRFLRMGIVEIGDGVLYLHPTALATIPSLQDQVVDGSAVWELAELLENPELGGGIILYAFRCKRRINSSDA